MRKRGKERREGKEEEKKGGEGGRQDKHVLVRKLSLSISLSCLLHAFDFDTSS